MKKFVLGLLVILALIAYTKRSSLSIQGQWQLVSYGSPSAQTPAVPDVEASIEFNTEGRISGNVGCNSFGGEYTVDGNTITFGSIMSTMMACMGPVEEQESAVLSVLQKSTTFVIDGNTMTVTSANGDASIVLGGK